MENAKPPAQDCENRPEEISTKQELLRSRAFLGGKDSKVVSPQSFEAQGQQENDDGEGEKLDDSHTRKVKGRLETLLVVREGNLALFHTQELEFGQSGRQVGLEMAPKGD